MLPLGLATMAHSAPAMQHPLLRRLRSAHTNEHHTPPALPPGSSLTDRASQLYVRHASEAAGFAAATESYRCLHRASASAAGPRVIITAPLGLQGGAAADALAFLAPDPHATVILTGTCPAGSPGRALQDARSSGALPAPGAVRCRVETYSLSAHADGDDTITLAQQLRPRAGVVLVHGQAVKSRPHHSAMHDAETAALASPKTVLQTRLRVPVYDPPDGVEVKVALPIEVPAAAAGPISA